MNDDLEIFEVTVDEPLEEAYDEPTSPSIDSPEWTDFVLLHLTEKEMYKGKPRADGLVRLVGKFFGDVRYTLQVHHVSPDYAAVTCVGITEEGVQYHGSAECSPSNTDPPFNKFPLATAETRALGRVAKRILKLTNVLTAEEDSEIARLEIPSSNEDRTEGGIQATQIKFIERMCKKLNVNLEKAVTNIVGEHNNINELSHAEALKINAALDAWARDEAKTYLELGVYNEDWRQNFFNKD